jgi:hypothetical protein
MSFDYTPPLYDHALDQDELDRMLLWRRQRDQRVAFRAQLQASLRGNPLAALQAQHNWQPLIDHKLDMSTSPAPPDPDSVPPSNQDLNT